MNKYDYELKRGNRRLISIKISEDNSITVSCNWRTPKEQVEKFLLEKSAWIDKNLAKNKTKAERFADILSYKQILVSGNKVPLFIDGGYEMSFSGVHISSISELKDLFIKNLSEKFLNIFKSWSDKTGLKCKNVSFKNYKSRWGCCDRYGNIVFNYKLLMLSESLWDYVILHELCHTIYLDHSKNFYSLICDYMPQYKYLLKELKIYGFISHLY